VLVLCVQPNEPHRLSPRAHTSNTVEHEPQKGRIGRRARGALFQRARVAEWSKRFPSRTQPAKNSMGYLLEVRHLTIQYRTSHGTRDLRPELAVDRICLAIEPGEVVGLMGESGCGKSSVALALLGLLPKASAEITGSVSFGSRELLAMKERALQKIRGAEISLVFQEPEIALSPMMRVGEQVAEVIHAHRHWNWKQCRAEAESMLARVGLVKADGIFSAYPHQLSGGQRQRVVLAQALSCSPALLIADEPTASLDARSQAGFLSLLRSLKDELRLAILLISHTPEIQASLADRLLVMKSGRIVEEGSFEQLYRHSSRPYTRAILRRSPRAIDAHIDIDSQAEIPGQEQLVR